MISHNCFFCKHEKKVARVYDGIVSMTSLMLLGNHFFRNLQLVLS